MSKKDLEGRPSAEQAPYFEKVPTAEAQQLISNLHNWLRGIDDIVDGDAEIEGNITVEELLDEKKTLLHEVRTGNTVSFTEYDTELQNALDVAHAHNIDIVPELETQLDIFDSEYEKRVNTEPLCDNELELRERARTGDTAVFSLALKSVGLRNPESLQLHTLNTGLAQRADWLADIDEDLAAGLITIPGEDIDEKNIRYTARKAESDVIEFEYSDAFKQWYKKSAEKLIEEWQEAKDADAKLLKNVLDEESFEFVWTNLWQKGIDTQIELIQDNVSQWFGERLPDIKH